MARLETLATLRQSGWSLTMLREGDDFSTFTEEMLEEMRAGAEPRMVRALDHIVGAIKRTLSRVYPPVSVEGSVFNTRSGTTRRRKGTKRQPSPSGAPPGKVTGELMDSWKRKKPTWSKNKTVLTGRYFSKHPAAGALEFGDPGRKSKRRTVFGSGRAAGGMEARPYQRPTVAREAGRLDAILDGTE